MHLSLTAVLFSLLVAGHCLPQHHPDLAIAKHEDSFRLEQKTLIHQVVGSSPASGVRTPKNYRGWINQFKL